MGCLEKEGDHSQSEASVAVHSSQDSTGRILIEHIYIYIGFLQDHAMTRVQD